MTGTSYRISDSEISKYEDILGYLKSFLLLDAEENLFIEWQ